jgi:hypothetical protein
MIPGVGPYSVLFTPKAGSLFHAVFHKSPMPRCGAGSPPSGPFPMTRGQASWRPMAKTLPPLRALLPSMWIRF